MNNSTNEQIIKKDVFSSLKQEQLIVLTQEEQTNVKGGATCNCSTNDKRIKRTTYPRR